MDDVAALQAGFGCRAARHHSLNYHAALDIETCFLFPTEIRCRKSKFPATLSLFARSLIVILVSRGYFFVLPLGNSDRHGLSLTVANELHFCRPADGCLGHHAGQFMLISNR